MLRTIRILGIAIGLAALARLSQQAGQALGNQDVAGYAVALAIVSLLFGIRAAASEFTDSGISEGRRDFLWGVSLGSFIAMLARLLR
jgi:hypothetical protein